jgi:hypothetical protein
VTESGKLKRIIDRQRVLRPNNFSPGTPEVLRRIILRPIFFLKSRYFFALRRIIRFVTKAKPQPKITAKLAKNKMKTITLFTIDTLLKGTFICGFSSTFHFHSLELTTLLNPSVGFTAG